MSQVTRRSFLAGSAALLGNGLAPSLSFGRAPSDEVRVAVVGLRGRGRSHIRAFSKMAGVRIVALCDVDRRVLEKAAGDLAAGGGDVETFVDFRALLEHRDVDAVSLATPNHWHALQTVWACQAGKDVYVEKPVSHNIWEGRQAVRAAEKYDRIVQAGTQIRSSRAIAEAFDWVRRGELGEILVARGFCYKPRKSIGKVSGPTAVDAAVDYDLWTGPAPKGPLMRERLHYDWHWVWDTGNGDIGNQGIHQVDLCRWALGEEGLAPRVLSVGGRLGYDDDGNTPNTQLVAHLYEKVPLLFEVRGLPASKAAQAGDWGEGMDEYDGVRIGIVVECEGGRLRVPSYSEAIAFDREGAEMLRWKGGSDQLHYQNFIDAVRTRDRSGLAMPLLGGHVSSALCHAGNVAHRTGRLASRNDARRELAKLPFAGEAFDRMCEHLERNGVPEADELRVGVVEIDPATESFRDPALDGWERRQYRAPFVVPEEV